MFISVIMIIVAIMFATVCPFAFRSQSGATKARITCAVLHIALFEIISVVALELFRVGYTVNEYVSNSVDPDIFRSIHTVACSALTAFTVAFVVVRLRTGELARAVTAGACALIGIGAAAGGYFWLRAIEFEVEREIGKEQSEAPAIIIDGLTNEYTVVALPILIGAALAVIFTAANILLGTDKKWMRAVTTAVNIIAISVYAIAFFLLLGIGSEIGDETGTAVYAMAIIGIIIALPPIICMCSVFADRIEAVNKAVKAKK